MTLSTRLRALIRDDSGQDLLEYALLAGLISLAAYGAVQMTGSSVNTLFGVIADTMDGVL